MQPLLQKGMGERVQPSGKRTRGRNPYPCPAPYTIKKEQDKVDPVTGEIMLDKDGMPEKEKIEIRIPAFLVVRVYDVSQTEGEPIQEEEPSKY